MVCNGRDYFIVCLSYSITATIQAWSSDFRGSAADVLLVTISDYLDKERECYARLTSIVNSSGTGKSRMVDEISRKIITVPKCLREYGSGGLARNCLALAWQVDQLNKRCGPYTLTSAAIVRLRSCLLSLTTGFILG